MTGSAIYDDGLLSMNQTLHMFVKNVFGWSLHDLLFS